MFIVQAILIPITAMLALQGAGFNVAPGQCAQVCNDPVELTKAENELLRLGCRTRTFSQHGVDRRTGGYRWLPMDRSR